MVIIAVIVIRLFFVVLVNMIHKIVLLVLMGIFWRIRSLAIVLVVVLEHIPSMML